jgi:hypothetical protein
MHRRQEEQSLIPIIQMLIVIDSEEFPVIERPQLPVPSFDLEERTHP